MTAIPRSRRSPGRPGPQGKPGKPGHLVVAWSLLAFAPACAFDLNESIRIGDGETGGSESTVNGGIEVGRDAVVDGSLKTVNGSIRIDANARTGRLETVNGTVRVGDGVTAADVHSVNGAVELGSEVTLAGGISVVNGRIELGPGTRVARDVSNVNGRIDVESSEIGGNLSTVNGDVLLSGDTILRGDLVVEKPDGAFRNSDDDDKPEIVIGPGVRVLGEIALEREVELYISESARVGGVTGVMDLSDAVRFSGDRP